MFGRVREAFHQRVVREGEVLPFRVEGTATLCRLVTEAGEVRVCFEGRDLARFHAKGLELRLMSVERKRFGTGYPLGEGVYEVILSPTNSVYRFRCVRGVVRPDVPVVPHIQWRGAGQEEEGQRPSVVLEFGPDDAGVGRKRGAVSVHLAGAATGDRL